MKIEKANIKDASEIANIEKICFPTTEAASFKIIKERITMFRNHFFVLKDNNVIIGFINGMVTDRANLSDDMYEDANLHNEKGLWQMVFGIDIIPKYQGQGYAGMLIRHFINVAKNENRNGIVLTCKQNLVTFYEHFGFCNEGISQSEHGGVRWHQMRLVFNKE